MRQSIFSIKVLFLSLVILMMACEPDEMEMNDVTPNPDPNQTTADFGLGWTGEDDLAEVPVSTNFGFGNTNLPASVDLTDKFPPIGDQGNYGTCVAWSVAYNAKTAMVGMDRGLSTGDLRSATNQFSPKDLFTAIPDNGKAPNCDGTNFTNPLNVLQERGVATMQTVPYTNLGDCSQANLQQNWTNEANQNRIKYWRRIDPTVQSIKQNLANNIPVIFGAKLADNFMTWNSDDVLSSNTTTNNVGQHAYHAMVILGYDDRKGPSGAFRVVNSWSDRWGDRGYIWIDYDFLVNEFCTTFNGAKPLFIIENEEGNIDPPDQNDPPAATGVDLAPWVFSDFSTYWTSNIPNERIIDFNLYNIGNQSASANSNWSYYYIYFNAFDANDYGVLFYDDFNTMVAPGTFQCPENYNCVFNFDIPAGGDFASSVWGWQSITRTYYMPEITGSYYLVMVADAGDVFNEQDELNNLFYTTNDPKWFNGGYALRPASGSQAAPSTAEFEFENKRPLEPTLLKRNANQSAVSDNFPNAYTAEEVMDFIKREKVNGGLQLKINEYIQRQDRAVFSK